jgi:hypothetical protein
MTRCTILVPMLAASSFREIDGSERERAGGSAGAVRFGRRRQPCRGAATPPIPTSTTGSAPPPGLPAAGRQLCRGSTAPPTPTSTTGSAPPPGLSVVYNQLPIAIHVAQAGEPLLGGGSKEQRAREEEDGTGSGIDRGLT